MLALVIPGFPQLVRPPRQLQMCEQAADACAQPTARNRRIAQAVSVMRRIGSGLIAERKADALYAPLPAYLRVPH
jgi:hypothetical protein